LEFGLQSLVFRVRATYLVRSQHLLAEGARAGSRALPQRAGPPPTRNSLFQVLELRTFRQLLLKNLYTLGKIPTLKPPI